ncbi:uncharacterized protein LOC118348919 [Juglans regia]|uniref:Uncharacterized protein LOC118348919 n=1 Tax=Juglans regia TaxID=51240 RepID=A0A6P9EJ22_JUGRE|nr:uncharacterized protein LOC118348919 [Juglans regia]
MGNPGSCGIGGVIRDASGGMVQAFASYVGLGSNNKAELLALLYGLRRFVSWWNRGRCGVWYLEDFWEEIVELACTVRCRFQHVYREGNRAADWLAKAGALGSEWVVSSSDNLPRVLRGLIRLDSLGFPSLRC